MPFESRLRFHLLPLDRTRRKIAGIWLIWVVAMILLAAITWALAMIAMPGGSSGTPAPEDVFGFFAHIGIWGSIKLLAVLFLPPIVLTILALRKRDAMD